MSTRGPRSRGDDAKPHNRRRLEHYEADVETLDRAATVLRDALRRMHDARLGFPATSTGPGQPGAVSRPVERALGLTGDDGHMATDPGRTAIATYDRLSHQLHTVAEAMHHLVSQWAPHQPDPRALADTERANVAECAHHRATIGVHEPMHCHGDAAGNLEEPIALCRWCWDFTRAQGRLPSRNELDRRARGLQVRVKAS